MDAQEKMDQLIEKVRRLKERGGFDLSREEDLSIAVMNLVSLEEHFFFTAEKTGKDDYFDFLKEVRELRKFLLGKLIDKHEGETWCIAKHLLAAAMRVIEVGTKLQGKGKKEEAREMFAKAYRIYSLFWAIRLKLIDVSDVKKIRDDRVNVHDAQGSKKPWTLEDIVNKLVDCCDE